MDSPTRTTWREGQTPQRQKGVIYQSWGGALGRNKARYPPPRRRYSHLEKWEGTQHLLVKLAHVGVGLHVRTGNYRGFHIFRDPSCLLRRMLKIRKGGTSLVVQWVRLRAPNAGGLGSIPGQGTKSHMHAATKSPHAATKSPAHCNKSPTCHN